MTSPFSEIHPARLIDAAQYALDTDLSALCRPYNSYINRVYEIESTDGTAFVIKLYRPGRWSEDAILDEHDFLLDLKDANAAVVAPIELSHGDTLGLIDEVPFAVFPKIGGRTLDEFDRNAWFEIGLLLGKLHAVGAEYDAEHRPILSADHSLMDHRTQLAQASHIPKIHRTSILGVIDQLHPIARDHIGSMESIRIHGDCHFANLLSHPNRPLTLIDFDDMVVGPPIQDLWMLLPGSAAQSGTEIEQFAHGYNQHYDFHPQDLGSIEVLRLMRQIHYLAWCAMQFIQDQQVRCVEQYGSDQYWNQEIQALTTQLRMLQSAAQG